MTAERTSSEGGEGLPVSALDHAVDMLSATITRAESAEAALTTARREVEELRGQVDHWKSHAEEAGRGFERVCRDYARVSAARTAAEDRLDAAREYVDDPGNWSALDGRRAILRAALANPSDETP